MTRIITFLPLTQQNTLRVYVLVELRLSVTDRERMSRIRDAGGEHVS